MKAILVFDKIPNSCDECEVRCGGYTAKDYALKGIKRPSWCPLKLMPERMKVDYETITSAEVSEKVIAIGWNACLEEIENESIINS